MWQRSSSFRTSLVVGKIDHKVMIKFHNFAQVFLQIRWSETLSSIATIGLISKVEIENNWIPLQLSIFQDDSKEL